MSRKVTIEELKKMIAKELGPVKDTSKLKVKLQPWDEAEPENDVDFIKSLKIREIFKSRL